MNEELYDRFMDKLHASILEMKAQLDSPDIPEDEKLEIEDGMVEAVEVYVMMQERFRDYEKRRVAY